MPSIWPRNTSGRSKAQIVAEAEATWMLSVLIGDIVHDENCRCLACFHRAADKLLQYQETLLESEEIKWTN